MRKIVTSVYFAVVLSCCLSAPIGIAGDAPSPGAKASTYAAAFERTTQLRDVGRQIFSDPSFSASGKQSCASCHDPSRRYSPADARDVQPGGVDGLQLGFRAPPTLTYLNRIPPYSNHYHDADDEGDESIDAGPTGGLTWDGRVDRGDNQAKIPLLSAFEMASSVAGVAHAIRATPYAATLRKALGTNALDADNDAFNAVVHALGVFEQDYDEFNPYTSKYDAWLTGHATLNAREQRGLKLFEDKSKGNCMQCHLSRRPLDASAPAFSDYGLIALGVPRNRKIPRNTDASFHDLGACGPERADKKGQAEFCGLFRTPTLRNVALRQTFFHNGSFHSLRDVVAFYVTRDITPERWYPKRADGSVDVYDDLPPAYHANLNREPPFADQMPGAKARLDTREIDDIVAFLGTLTDGYLKENPYRAERRQLHAKPGAKPELIGQQERGRVHLPRQRKEPDSVPF
ncbi:MAG: cytochrome c peroxidase [Dokdonella sp.]